MQIIFAAEILVIRFAKMTSFKRGWNWPGRQIECKANRQQNHAASGIVSNKKVMKAARDYQLHFCSSVCNKGYYLHLFQSHVVVVVHYL